MTRRVLLAGLATAASPSLAQSRWQPGRPPPQILVRSPHPPQTQPMQLWTGEIGGTFLKIGSDISVVASEAGLAVAPVISRGTVANIHALINVKGADLALAAADGLAYVAQDPALRAQLGNIRYIAKLYDSEFHLLARDPAIRTITDLDGKRICTDVEGSGTSVTCSTVFDMLGLSAQIVSDNPGRGLMMLRGGQIDALAYVIGKPGVMFRSQPTDGLHLVEIPLTESLASRYVPATFVPADYPGMVPDGSEVASIAVGAVLACYGWPAGTERYRNLERFVQAFVAALPEMGQPPFHPKWRQVSMAAEVSGWQRFAPVADAIQAERTARESSFDTFLASIGQSKADESKLNELRATFEKLRPQGR